MTEQGLEFRGRTCIQPLIGLHHEMPSSRIEQSWLFFSRISHSAWAESSGSIGSFVFLCKMSTNLSNVQVFVYNRPFPSCLVPLFESESWCIAFHMKMSFYSHADKTHFHMRSFARGLALKKRHKTIRKWPVVATSAKKKSV